MSNQANFTQNARQTESLNNLNSNLVAQKASQDATGTLLTSMKATQESIVAGINNPELADTTVGKRSYVYAHDAVNSKARALKCDATGRLECSVDALEISADTINLNTDQLETKIGETNSLLTARLPPLLTGSGNLKVSIQELGNEGSERLNTEANVAQLPSALTGEGNLKVSIQEDFTHNLSTSAKQDDIITAVNATTTSINSRMASVVSANVDTKNSVDAVALTTGATASNTASILSKNGEIETSLNSILEKNGEIENHLETISENQSTFADGDSVVISGGVVLPSALTGSGNLKVCIQELGNEGSERLNVDVGSTNTKLPSSLSGAGNLKVSIQEGNISGFSTASLQGGGLPSALSSDNLKVSLKETITMPVSHGALTKLDNAIFTGVSPSTKMNVNISSGNISGFSTASLQGGGLPSALSSDNLKVSLKESITVPVSHGALTELASAINSDKVDVNISSGNISGFSTASLQGGGLPSALSSDNLKVSLKETITMPVSHGALTELASAINSDKVDVNISSGNISGFSTASLQGGGLPSALSSDNLKVSLKETITMPVSNAGLTELASAINNDRCDVSAYLSTQTAIGSATLAHNGSSSGGSVVYDLGTTPIKLVHYYYIVQAINTNVFFEGSLDNSTYTFLGGITFLDASAPTGSTASFKYGNVKFDNPPRYVRIKNYHNSTAFQILHGFFTKVLS